MMEMWEHMEHSISTAFLHLAPETQSPLLKQFIESILANMSKIANDLSNADTLAHVERVWAERKPKSPIYQFLLGDIKLTFASKGVVRARLQLTKNHVNSRGGIHGTTSQCLVDWVGGIAIVSYDLRNNTGVSTDIHVSYASSAKEGDWIEVEGTAQKVGGTLAFTTVKISKVVDDEPGPIIATGSHTKFVKI